MSASSELKRAWEKRFPPLSAAWSHWRLEGDGFLLGVVSGERLVDALRLLEENHERYASILVRRASVNAAGEISSRRLASVRVRRCRQSCGRVPIAYSSILGTGASRRTFMSSGTTIRRSSC